MTTTDDRPGIPDRVHLWPFGSRITGTSRCTACGITWAEHHRQPNCTPDPSATCVTVSFTMEEAEALTNLVIFCDESNGDDFDGSPLQGALTALEEALAPILREAARLADPDQTDEHAVRAAFDAAVDRIHPRLRSGSGVLMGTAPTPAEIAEALAEVLPGCPSGLTLRQCEFVLSLYGQERRRDAMRLVRASHPVSVEKRPDSAGRMRNQTVIYAGTDPA
jgi:hypothetical protein